MGYFFKNVKENSSNKQSLSITEILTPNIFLRLIYPAKKGKISSHIIHLSKKRYVKFGRGRK